MYQQGENRARPGKGAFYSFFRNKSFARGGYIVSKVITMRLADIAQITLDPQHILQSAWAHDAAHAFVDAKRRALQDARTRRSYKP